MDVRLARRALRPGRYVLAPPAAYRVEAVGEDVATVTIAAGSARLVGRRFEWPLTNLLASLALGDATIGDETAKGEGDVRDRDPGDDAPRLLPD